MVTWSSAKIRWPRQPYGFESRPGHHLKTTKGWEVLIKLSLDPSRYRVLAQLVRALA